jgi:hypothetical protein
VGRAGQHRADVVRRGQQEATCSILDTPGKKLVDFVFTLKDIRADDIVMVRTNGGRLNPLQIGDTSYEVLDERSLRLFQSVRDDTVQQYLVSHPEFLSPG